MKKSTKTIVHDEELQIEACHFQGITQSFPNHFHEYHVIGCIEQGQRRLSCRNRDYTVGKGVILLFSPGDSHACTQKQGGALDYRSFHIPNKTMHHFIQKITGTTFSPHFSANVLYDRKIFRSFLTLHENIMKNSGEYGRREDFERFLSPLVRRCMLPDSSCGDREHREEVGKACRFMEQNYTARICLEDLCRCAGLSRTALTRAFVREKGVTPYLYLENIRIREAGRLLQKGVSPSEAALRTGFGDQSHFTHCFSRFIGLSPGIYRGMFTDRTNNAETRLPFAHTGSSETEI